MGYEQDEPYVVNDEGGEYIAQTPTEESARKHLIEYFTHQDALLDHIGTGNNATIDLTIAVAEFDLEHPDLYKFQPTAEWSRIQQALKERDELAAELERVKAERDELKSNSFSDDLKTMSILAETDQHIKDCKTFLEEFKKLSSLKPRLPVNADGDVPDIGDDIWEWFEEHKCPGKNSLKKLLKDKDGWCYIDMYGIRRRPQDFHSTAESCRAANEKGENDE